MTIANFSEAIDYLEHRLPLEVEHRIKVARSLISGHEDELKRAVADFSFFQRSADIAKGRCAAAQAAITALEQEISNVTSKTASLPVILLQLPAACPPAQHLK